MDISRKEDLNSYFRSMSEYAQEEIDWNSNSKFIISRIKLLSALTTGSEKLTSPYPVEFDVFGSSAEDLKFCLPNDIGDIDIMVYPVYEESIIDDTAIETVDGVAPVFVRLRGAKHPVLQHCTAENSEFVSTSALKEFHPKIFGQKTPFLKLIPRTFSRVNELDLDYIASGVVDNPTGPSFQLDVKHSFGSITDQVREQTGEVFNATTKTHGFRNFLEWFAINVNPQRTFTEEHSACIDEFLTAAQVKSQTFMENPSVQSYHDTLNQLIGGDQMLQLTHKVKEIDQRVQDGGANSNCSNAGTAAGRSSPSFQNAVSSQANLPNANEKDTIDEATNRHDSSVDGTKNVHKCGREISSDDQSKENRGTFELGYDLAVDHPQNVDEYDKETEREGKSSGEATSRAVPRDVAAANENQMTVSDVQNLLTQQLLDGMFAKTSSTAQVTGPVEKQLSASTTRPSPISEPFAEHRNKIIQSGIDLVPALKGRGWPKVAKAWAARARAWPSQDIISKILESGYHVVVKSPPGNTDHADQFFRLSFSRAELILSGELNNVQRESYRCLKRYYRHVLEKRQVKIITSYFLKTVLLWTVEETGPDVWSEENRATCVLMLLERLHKYLESKFLPLYFIPEVNLLENAVIDYPEEVEYIANKFKKICENPKIYPIMDKGGLAKKTTEEHVTTPEESTPSDTKGKAQENVSNTNERRNAKEAPKYDTNAEKLPESHSTNDCRDEDSSRPDVASRNKHVTDSANFFLKYDEFQAIYRDVYKDLIDIVLHGNSFRHENPVIDTIVKNLKAVARKMGNPEAELTTVLEFCTKDIYSTHVMHSGCTARQRILSALKGYSEIFSFSVAQEDLLAEGNEHLIVARMLNSDSFNVANALMPNCVDAFKEIVHIFDVPTSPSLQPCEDEIPLD